ncbi:Predicted O-linked N-acetylglucosamine transferase, SPINDLY family [Tistlia consotensis]|uniref:Predicted O-linked N-acetylglucosamine transferase, SPINDLY family n=1 Tax=Tistlia consotensis USBA 355 TaxID=560819 RepID=A0A1Y6BG09_9PROT|nr:hypothetical protein [Tistlia consotensis]SMF09155.1 Predicted O-linked N-acetylglucosamine transferase, SPINDLY family [Tistlia consotensis USBA 355]SNR34793.1 Predicted O-linked N-acetylglucosamine transferase, SPINDLY family [Tistlia consotensis]
MKQDLCDWRGLDALAARLVEQAERVGQPLDPFRFLTLTDDEAAQQRNARRWARRFETARQQPRPAVARDRIALGYLSADLQHHATAHLMAQLFELHDRRRFSVTAYSLGADDGSAERRRLLRAFDRFVDCAGLPAEAVARRIAEEETDILIDLKGYTRDAAPRVLAARPAPVQVQWIGFPGTLGASFVDYLLADRLVLPDPARGFYDERVVRLPGSYQVNDRRRPRPRTAPPRAAFGLPEGGPVAACFNNPNKLTPKVFALWMRLLAAVGDATLWLLCDRAEGRANLRAAAEGHGIDGRRLVFATKLPLEAHLARYRHVDLFLDTLPYNAHTTASDALWMGCPLVTRIGDSFAGRVAASLLAAVGLERYVTRTPEAYEAVARRLLQSPEERTAVREHLARNPESLPLFDTPRTTAAVERAYETMWARALAGLAPQSFDL